MFCNNFGIGFYGTETNNYCRIAHILGILLMNSCNTDIFFSNYYHLQSVRFEQISQTSLSCDGTTRPFSTNSGSGKTPHTNCLDNINSSTIVCSYLFQQLLVSKITDSFVYLVLDNVSNGFGELRKLPLNQQQILSSFTVNSEFLMVFLFYEADYCHLRVHCCTHFYQNPCHWLFMGKLTCYLSMQ